MIKILYYNNETKIMSILDISKQNDVLVKMTDLEIVNSIIKEQFYLQFIIGIEKKNIENENYKKCTTLTQNTIEYLKELIKRKKLPINIKKKNFEISKDLRIPINKKKNNCCMIQ